MNLSLFRVINILYKAFLLVHYFPYKNSRKKNDIKMAQVFRTDFYQHILSNATLVHYLF